MLIFWVTYLTLLGHKNRREKDHYTVEQYGDWYTGGLRTAPPSPIVAVPNITACPSTASVPTSYYSVWHYNCL